MLANRRPQRVLEVGTAAGHMTANFSEWSPDNAVVFSLGTLVGIPAGTTEQAYENPDRAHFGAQANHFGKARKIQLITADSLTYDFRGLAPLDFAFIDGAHDVEHVLSDSLKVYHELAPGGYLVWHDFNSPVAWVEVRKALEQTDFQEPIYHVAGTEVAFLSKADGKSEALRPGLLLHLILAGWVNQRQQQINDYLRTENQILREILGKHRILLDDDQRRRWPSKAKVLAASS